MSIRHKLPARLTSLALMAVAALMAIAMFYGVSAEIRDGIVHHKRGGMSSRDTDPFFFWLDIGLQIAVGLLFTGLTILAGYLSFRRRP